MVQNWHDKVQHFEEGVRKNLPSKGAKNILITSALPYVNNVPHLGNIIGSVLSADVFSRYCRLRNYKTLFVCGTDEYGTATEMKALKEGLSPKEICDKFHKLHKSIYDWFSIDFDHFGRTTTEYQTEICQDIFNKVHQNGFTSTSTLEQMYCEMCDKFLADRFVFGTCPICNFDDARGDQCDGCGKLIDAADLIEPRCYLCQQKPLLKTSKHIFLDLDRLAPAVEKHINTVVQCKNSRWSANAISIVRSWLKSGLEKRCITRDLKWGTPVPLKEFFSKVFYVWFDAPIGYLSITKSFLGDDWTKWWKNPEQVELFHFLGKDNVAFHGVVFPATQIATKENFTKVSHICATEYLNYEDKKFSKSRGIGVFGDSVAQTGIPADIWRFYLLYMRPELQDTVFSWDDFLLKVNSELLANLGNFVNRALAFIYKFFNAEQPNVELSAVEDELIKAVNVELTAFINDFENIKLRDALTKVLAVSRLGNQYMQTNKPWELTKGTDADKQRAGSIIGMMSNLVVLLSTMLYPFIPNTSKEIRRQCNLDKCICLPEHFVQFLQTGHKIVEPQTLFTKLEQSQIQEFKQRFGSSDESASLDKEAKTNKKFANKDKPAKNILLEKSANMSQSPKKHYTDQFPEIAANHPELIILQTKTDSVLKSLEQQFEIARTLFLAKELQPITEKNKVLQNEVEDLKVKLGFIPVISSNTTPKTTNNNIPTLQVSKNVTDSAKLAKKEKAPKPEKPATPKATDDVVDVGRLDFRVGRILEAKKHPDADALYIETIDLGEEKARTVVSGLVRFVPIEQMQNRLVVCLCNLKPAKMRGIESQAMVMCASTSEKVEIMEVDSSCKPGDRLISDKFPSRPDTVLNPKKKIWETVAPDLKVDAYGAAVYKGELLKINGIHPMRAPTLRDVQVK